MLDIARWAQSKIGFYVDRHYVDGQWLLEPGPIRLAPYHADLLTHIFTPDESGRLPYDVIGWCEPAKSGKSAIAGLVAQYVSLHGERNSTIVMASNKQNQAASLMYKSFTDSVGYNPALDLEPGKLAVELPNGNMVKAIPSNSKGEAGARFSLALFDELWAYVYQDAQRLWSEFKTDPTRLNSVKLAIGYAGYIGEGELWLDLLEGGKKGEPVPELEHIVNDDGKPACWRNGRTFVFWSNVCRQPWQTDEWVAEQRRTLRAAEFARMIRCEFVQGLGDFGDPDDWLACIDPDAHPLPSGDRRYSLHIGLDLAVAAGGDDCALVAVYADADGKARVAFHKVWKGKDRRRPLKLGETVRPYLERAYHNYSIAGVYADPWQARLLCDELRGFGINVQEIPQTHASRGPKDTRLYEAVCNRELVMYDHPDLKNAAMGASAQELGNGNLFIKKQGRLKIDMLIAMANCVDEALGPQVWAFL